MKTKLLTFFLLPLGLILGTVIQAKQHDEHHHGHDHHAADNFRQHDAHQHGLIEFHIAQDGTELLIEITAPSHDLMGFEHRPETQEQKLAYNRALTSLETPDSLFVVNREADCRLNSKNVEFSLDNDKNNHDHDHDHDHSHKSTHSEFHAEYYYTCQNPKKINSMKYHWFTVFPATKEISVAALTDKGAKSQKIELKSTTFTF